MAKAVEELIKTLRTMGIVDEIVLDAVKKVPREEFVNPDYREQAYEDTALPFALGQTISQPFVVARMSELLREGKPLVKVLEIGTGTGYQAAVLSHLAEHVYSIERIKGLYQIALKRLKSYQNIHIKCGDGHQGWRQYAPYDAIIVTAASAQVPSQLLDQLAHKGRLVVPIGETSSQVLTVVLRDGDSFSSVEYDAVRFVPMLPGIED